MRKFGDLQEDGTSTVTVEDARKYLGRFGLTGELALNPVTTLSGGQKSRLAFAGLAWKQPHLLLLDESAITRTLFVTTCDNLVGSYPYTKILVDEFYTNYLITHRMTAV